MYKMASITIEAHQSFYFNHAPRNATIYLQKQH